MSFKGGDFVLYVDEVDLSSNLVLIVDTEDGVSECVHIRGDEHSLEDCVCRYGLSIVGAEVAIDKSGNKVLSSVKPTVPDGVLTAAQVKLKALTGVGLRIHGDRIVDICCKSKLYQREVTIRLSDYGVVCCDFMFRVISSNLKGKLTFILDDKLSFEHDSLEGLLGVYLDLREVTREDILDFVYSAYASKHNKLVGFAGQGFDYIIDHSDRLALRRAEFVISNGINMPDVTCSSDIAQKVYERYCQEFKPILNMRFKWRSKLDGDTKGLAKRYSLQFYDARSHISDYDYLLSVFSPTVVNFVERFIECDWKSFSLRRLNNYLLFFDTPGDIKSDFINMYKRLFKFLDSV